MTEVKPKEEAGRFPGFAVEGSGTADNVSTCGNINPAIAVSHQTYEDARGTA